jgi:hypothetical protein
MLLEARPEVAFIAIRPTFRRIEAKRKRMRMMMKMVRPMP